MMDKNHLFNLQTMVRKITVKKSPKRNLKKNLVLWKLPPVMENHLKVFLKKKPFHVVV
jgi:hypothetical protein